MIFLILLSGSSYAEPLIKMTALNDLNLNTWISNTTASVNLLTALRIYLPRMTAGVCWDYMIYVDRCSRCPVEIQLCIPVAAGFKTCFPGIVVTYCIPDQTTCTFDEDYPGGGTCQINPF